MNERRHRHIDRDHGGCKRAEQDTTLRTEVKLVGGEHDADGQAREDNGNHRGQNVGQALEVKGGATPTHAEQRADEQLLECVASGGKLCCKAVSVCRQEDQQHRHKDRNQNGEQAAGHREQNLTFLSHGKPS